MKNGQEQFTLPVESGGLLYSSSEARGVATYAEKRLRTLSSLSAQYSHHCKSSILYCRIYSSSYYYTYHTISYNVRFVVIGSFVMKSSEHHTVQHSLDNNNNSMVTKPTDLRVHL